MLASLSPGRFAGLSLVGTALGLRGPRWAEEKKSLWPVFPWWEESPGPPREGEPLGVTFVGRDRDRVRVFRDVTRWCVTPRVF